ncbi:hypothetical protein D3C76_1182780 [compost metagenome]
MSVSVSVPMLVLVSLVLGLPVLGLPMLAFPDLRLPAPVLSQMSRGQLLPGWQSVLPQDSCPY